MSKLKSVVVAFALSFPLVACASQELPGVVSAGGGSGGSPLAGSPTFASEAAVVSTRAALRDVSGSREAPPRYELRLQEVLTCRQCK